MGPGPKILAYCLDGETLCVDCHEDSTPVIFDGDEWMDVDADSDEIQELCCDGCNKVIDTYEPEPADDDDDDGVREATPEEKEEALRYQEQQNEENRRKRES
jgi:hypothetical protein